MVENTISECLLNAQFYFLCFLLKIRSQSIPKLLKKSPYNWLYRAITKKSHAKNAVELHEFASDPNEFFLETFHISTNLWKKF